MARYALDYVLDEDAGEALALALLAPALPPHAIQLGTGVATTLPELSRMLAVPIPGELRDDGAVDASFAMAPSTLEAWTAAGTTLLRTVAQADLR